MILGMRAISAKALLPPVFAGLVLLFGLGCLNYTKGEDWAHHAAWAESRGLPPPSCAIFYAGAAATAIGAGALGFRLGRRRAGPRPS